MFIELVDLLRCPRLHEESWLVLSASRMRDRHVMEGELGCHVCQSHFMISEGVAVFDGSAVGSVGGSLGGSDQPATQTPDAAFRMAALLGLAEPGGVVLMVGQHAALAPMLASIISDTQFLCLNGMRSDDGLDDARISRLLASQRLPVSAGSCRAAVVDLAHATSEFLSESTRVLRGGGRLVIPAEAAMPESVVELARDSTFIVAERTATPGPLIPLHSARRK